MKLKLFAIGWNLVSALLNFSIAIVLNSAGNAVIGACNIICALILLTL